MRSFARSHATELALLCVTAVICVFLSLASDRFFTLGNAFDLLNTSSVNIIFAVGLLVVLIAGGIDISFAVAASVVQYLTASVLGWIGGGNWLLGLLLAGAFGVGLGCINALLIHKFKIISIVATISTFNIYFGLLMFFTGGVSIYNLPDWMTTRVVLFEREMADGSWAEITLPVLIMARLRHRHLGADHAERRPAGSSIPSETIPRVPDGSASISPPSSSSPSDGSD